MKLYKIIPLLLIFSVSNIFAADPPPLTLMKKVTGQTLAALQRNKGRLTNRTIHNIVNRYVVPYFDMPSVARSVVGRTYWSQSSSGTRSQFIITFKGYVIDMYSSALSTYSNEKIIFKPMRSYSSSQTRVKLYSTIKRSGAPPVSLNYRLVRYGKTWRIYDFSVDGVSMVHSYRAQFADTLRRAGLAGLTKQLQARRR